MLRPSFRYRPPVFGMLIGLMLGMVLGAVIGRAAVDPPDSRVQVTHSQELDADLIGLRTDPYRGPERVRACLYDRDLRCTQDRWLPIEAIDTTADAVGRIRQFNEIEVLGCVYVYRHNACACERHRFILPLKILSVSR